MKNISSQYKDLLEGKISRDNFVRNCRQQFPQYISPVTSIDDAIKILKSKRIISEAIQEDYNTTSLKEVKNNTEGLWKETTGKDQYGVYSDLDNVNFTTFLRAVAFEVGKQEDMSDEMLPSILEKIAKKMKKDPMAYRDLVIANTAEIAKQDETLKMKEVKPGNMIDKDNGMKEVKGQEKPKATSAPKSENKKGKPKGVKEMGFTPKKATGIKSVMDMPGKEKVIDQLKESLKKTLVEDTHYKYAIGQGVETPQGPGVVTGIIGGTVTVQFEDGKSIDYQINILDKQAEKSVSNPWNKLQAQSPKVSSWLSSQLEENLPAEEINSDVKSFEDMMKNYDWYHEMSDDYRKIHAGIDLDHRIKTLGRKIGADRAADIWNSYAPLDRKRTASFFMEEKKDKYSKLREYIKKVLKKEAVKFKAAGETIFTSDSEAPSKEAELRRAGIKFTKSTAR